MKKFFPALLLGLACALCNCQRPQDATSSLDTTPPVNATDSMTTASATGGPATEASARMAVRSYVQELPNRAVYQLDSAQVMEAGTQYQVLVPRTDWAGRMPNKAAFNVDKQTGVVTVQPVK